MKNQKIIEAVIDHVGTFADHLEDFKDNGNLDQLKNNFDKLHDAIIGAHGKDHLLNFMNHCKEHITDAISFIENVKHKGEAVVGRALVTIEHFQNILNHMNHKIHIITRSNAVDDVTVSDRDARAAEEPEEVTSAEVCPAVVIDASPEEVKALMKSTYTRQSTDTLTSEDTDVISEDSDVDSDQKVGHSEEDISDSDDDSDNEEDLEQYPDFFIKLDDAVAAMRMPFVAPVSHKVNLNITDDVIDNLDIAGNTDNPDVIIL